MVIEDIVNNLKIRAFNERAYQLIDLIKNELKDIDSQKLHNVENYKKLLTQLDDLEDHYDGFHVITEYNKLIRFPFKFRAENLYKKDNTYDIILVLSYNSDPVIKNKGSAIFLHIAKKNHKDTNGCVAVYKTSLKKIIKIIDRKTIIKII